jgi:hypothetical protein
MSVVSFFSYSRGRKRRKRKFPRKVILIRIRPSKRWFFWDGKDCGLPWDEWATEIIGEKDRWEFEENDSYLSFPGDYLRRRVLDFLSEFDGKF